MKQKTKQGIIVDGSIRSAGVTFYTSNGRTIVRSSVSRQPKRRTEKQFLLRQRLTHSISLWFYLSSACTPLLTKGNNAYCCFRSLAAKLPPVFLTQGENSNGTALLMPGIPVSCGTLPDIVYSLGEAEGSPALLTGLTPADLRRGERRLLLTLEQVTGQGVPQLGVVQRVLAAADFTVADGLLVLTGEEFADEHLGWALVRQRGCLCSSQTVVTRSTLHLQYQTPEAFLRAAASYGGLTG